MITLFLFIRLASLCRHNLPIKYIIIMYIVYILQSTLYLCSTYSYSCSEFILHLLFLYNSLITMTLYCIKYIFFIFLYSISVLRVIISLHMIITVIDQTDIASVQYVQHFIKLYQTYNGMCMADDLD